MHPNLKTGNVAIYARFSSDNQRETSIEDQLRRCRAFVAQGGGDPARALIFPDFADSAASFMLLQFASVPLLGVADGIDTSAKGAKLAFTVKSLLSDIYLDDLRDKTLRGLEGRALAGFATGGVPYGFHTVPVLDDFGRSIGSRIENHVGEAEIVRRIFREHRDGRGLAAIAMQLNRDGIPSPRSGTRHKRLGGGASTIRAILHNARYVGVWRFKERQWVKAPGTNKRVPRQRDASEVITLERPELRIIDPALWQDTQTRLAAIRNRYTGGKQSQGAVRNRTSYLFSGVLVCDACGGPMTIIGGSSCRYYACATNRTKGTCENKVAIKEPNARARILEAIQERLTSEDGVMYVRQRVAEYLRDYSKNLDAEIKDRRDRIKRTEDKIRGLIEFVAQGDRSEYVTSTLKDLETYVLAEKAAVAQLVEQAQAPLRLPSVEEITSMAYKLNQRIQEDPMAGRAQLIRWLREGQLRVLKGPDGKFDAKGELLPLTILAEAQNDNAENTKPANHLAGRYTHFVAEAGFEPATFGL